MKSTRTASGRSSKVKDVSSGGTWTLTRLKSEDVLTVIKDDVLANRTFRFIESTSSRQRANLSDRLKET